MSAALGAYYDIDFFSGKDLKLGKSIRLRIKVRTANLETILSKLSSPAVLQLAAVQSKVDSETVSVARCGGEHRQASQQQRAITVRIFPASLLPFVRSFVRSALCLAVSVRSIASIRTSTVLMQSRASGQQRRRVHV